MDHLPLRTGNQAFRAHDFAEAISYYLQALKQRTAHIKSITFNIELAKKRFLESRFQLEKPVVLLVAGDLTSIDTRMLNLAALYDDHAEPGVLIGTNVKHAAAIVSHRTRYPNHTFTFINELDDFPFGVLDFVGANPCDIVHLCSTGPFNVALGLLYKAIWGSKVIVDFGLGTSAFSQFANTDYIWLQFLQSTGQFLRPTSTTPVLLKQELTALFDGFTVASPLVRESVDGEVVRITPSEFPLPPAAAARQGMRQALGIGEAHKVLLCIGDLSLRQTALDLANTITRIDVPDLFLAIPGDSRNTAAISLLEGILGNKIRVVPTTADAVHSHPFSIADACFLLPADEVHSQNQFFFDLAAVMALGIPTLTTVSITHFPNAIAAGAVSLTTTTMMARKLDECFSNTEAVRKQRYAVEGYFLAELSKTSNQTRLLNCCRRSGSHKQTFDPLLRSLFALAGISSAYNPTGPGDISEAAYAGEANSVIRFDVTRPRKLFDHNPAIPGKEQSGWSLLSINGASIGYCDRNSLASPHKKVLLSQIGVFLKISGATPRAELKANSGRKSDINLWDEADVISSLPAPLSLPGIAAIADVWFCSRNELRIKLDVYPQSSPRLEFYVFQFYQVDCKSGTLTRCAQHTVATDSLGIIDTPLINQYMPLLVTAHDSTGLLHAATVLPFPSLARGGCHAGEIRFNRQWGASNTALVDASIALAEQWLGSTGGDPMLQGIRIDARGANGSERIFSTNFLSWLRTVFGVEVQLQASAEPEPMEAEGLAYLAMAIDSCSSSGSTGSPARSAGSWLRHPPHAIPTLQALTASAADSVAFLQPGVTYLIADSITCESTRLISIPGNCDLLDQLQAQFTAPDYPVLGSGNPRPEPALIPLKTPQNALPLTINFPVEPNPVAPCLLMPVAMDYRKSIFASSRDVSKASNQSSLTVILKLQSNILALETFLACLGQQRNIGGIDIIAVMTASFEGDKEAAVNLLERYFPSHHRLLRRVELASTRQAPIAIPATTGSFILVAADSLSLHDNRTLAVLCAIAGHAKVAATSCQLVQQITTSKEIDFRLAASGQCAVYDDAVQDLPTLQPIEDHGLFAGMTYPVAVTNTAITVFAADTVKRLGINLLGAISDAQSFRKLCHTAESKGYINVCTGIVTATDSSLSDKDSKATPFRPDEISYSVRISSTQPRIVLPA